eukprot:gnl/TRDRNA2_/TRDRNA2_187289_c0_seq1.p1 gnl/TRDRNA2_/TRDRNA2_187289_c0~~gnl/TRDRNA2_/TRDRNA2_187289_c0_seq1.p1  ORF type:complete len:429 (+),score=51.92 gnl/TRDRNA2_/TRDRNA2_187289_c0_seq1:126-1289(+)
MLAEASSAHQVRGAQKTHVPCLPLAGLSTAPSTSTSAAGVTYSTTYHYPNIGAPSVLNTSTSTTATDGGQAWAARGAASASSQTPQRMPPSPLRSLSPSRPLRTGAGPYQGYTPAPLLPGWPNQDGTAVRALTPTRPPRAVSPVPGSPASNRSVGYASYETAPPRRNAYADYGPNAYANPAAVRGAGALASGLLPRSLSPQPPGFDVAYSTEVTRGRDPSPQPRLVFANARPPSPLPARQVQRALSPQPCASEASRIPQAINLPRQDIGSAGDRTPQGGALSSQPRAPTPLRGTKSPMSPIWSMGVAPTQGDRTPTPMGIVHLVQGSNLRSGSPQPKGDRLSTPTGSFRHSLSSMSPQVPPALPAHGSTQWQFESLGRRPPASVMYA